MSAAKEPEFVSRPVQGSPQVKAKRAKKVKSPVPHRRHEDSQDSVKTALSKPAMRRMARKASIIRISGESYEWTRGYARKFLQNVIRKAGIYAEHAHRKTYTQPDVERALKVEMGITVY